MRRRPWPIVILAFLQLLLPAFTVLLASTFYSMEPGRYLRVLYYLKSQTDFYLFFLLPLVAALAIFVVRKWSYPLFLGVMIWTLYSDLSHWTMSSTVFPTILLVSTYAFNILLVSYLMIPAVWALYFNPKFAWWRSKPRYLLSHVGRIRTSEGEISCRVLDVSKGGSFVEGGGRLSAGTRVTLEFEYCGMILEAPGVIKHSGEKGSGIHGYGIEFGKIDPKNKKILNEIVGSLKRLDLAQVTQEMLKKEGFIPWLTQLIRTGHGLVPQLPNNQKKTNTPRLD